MAVVAGIDVEEEGMSFPMQYNQLGKKPRMVQILTQYLSHYAILVRIWGWGGETILNFPKYLRACPLPSSTTDQARNPGWSRYLLDM